MKKVLATGALVLFLAGPAIAVTEQQQKMKDCNVQAGQKQLKGDARKQFMSECLGADHSKVASQQQKMKDCNADASKQSLKGDARKQFMSSCLSK